jgi:hypothetical protein
VTDVRRQQKRASLVQLPHLTQYFPPSYLHPSRLSISPLMNDSSMRMQHNVEMG